MDETFKIYIHRLKEGGPEKIEETLSPQFLGIEEEGLAFHKPVYLEGEASVADGSLVLHLHIETEATMPCAICNNDVQVKISIPDFYYTEEISQIKGAVFDYSPVVRQEVLIAVPFTAECNQGDCPERASLAKYFQNRS